VVSSRLGEKSIVTMWNPVYQKPAIAWVISSVVDILSTSFTTHSMKMSSMNLLILGSSLRLITPSMKIGRVKRSTLCTVPIALTDFLWKKNWSNSLDICLTENREKVVDIHSQ